MKKKIRIGSRYIGDMYPCLIIAEAGVNHNGDPGLARKLVNAAARAGAEAIKFQTFKAAEVVTAEADMAPYQKRNLKKISSQRRMLEKYELSEKDFLGLKQYCRKKKIIFLSTPHSLEAVSMLKALVPAYKIGSGDLTNLPLLKAAARTGKPVFLSTGMADLEEISRAVRAIRSAHDKFVLLQCTSQYPCPAEEANLKAMETLRHKFNCLAGYSDHTPGFLAAVTARALGAAVIEKHFTLDKNMPGPDHRASCEPEELALLVTYIRQVEAALGSGKKKPTKEEIKAMPLVRKSLVAKVDIPKGTVLNKDMLAVKRPGTGISPFDLEKVIGRRALVSITGDTVLGWRQLSEKKEKKSNGR